MGELVDTQHLPHHQLIHQLILSRLSEVQKMKLLVVLSLILYFSVATLDANPIDDGYLVPRPGPAQQRLLYDPALLEELYERGLLEDQQQPDVNERPKRRWWGNKYKDNKSYGFWITALNKAGNWKKRSYPEY